MSQDAQDAEIDKMEVSDRHETPGHMTRDVGRAKFMKTSQKQQKIHFELIVKLGSWSRSNN